jgi:hypothetical protein
METYHLEDVSEWLQDMVYTTAGQPAPVQPVAINEVQKLSDGFIENPEAIKYLLDCLRWAQGEEGLPQTHYNFIRAFQRKGYAVLQRLNEDYGPEWTFSKHATTPPAAQPAVPDAIHHTDLSEHPQYIEGWNDCRAEMLKGMKP